MSADLNEGQLSLSRGGWLSPLESSLLLFPTYDCWIWRSGCRWDRIVGILDSSCLMELLLLLVSTVIVYLYPGLFLLSLQSETLCRTVLL